MWKKTSGRNNAANAAIEAAKTAEAAVYVPAEFAAVQDSLNAVMADVTAQESKLFKKFGPAKEKLASILTLANQVASSAVPRRKKLKQKLLTYLLVSKLLSKRMASLSRNFQEEKKVLPLSNRSKAEVATVDASVVEAQGLFDKGSFMDALNKIKAAKEKADGLNAEVKEVLTKARIKF